MSISPDTASAAVLSPISNAQIQTASVSRTVTYSGNSSSIIFCIFGLRYMHFRHHLAIQSTTINCRPLPIYSQCAQRMLRKRMVPHLYFVSAHVVKSSSDCICTHRMCSMCMRSVSTYTRDGRCASWCLNNAAQALREKGCPYQRDVGHICCRSAFCSSTALR